MWLYVVSHRDARLWIAAVSRRTFVNYILFGKCVKVERCSRNTQCYDLGTNTVSIALGHPVLSIS
jgi:hypothetical protein